MLEELGSRPEYRKGVEVSGEIQTSEDVGIYLSHMQAAADRKSNV